MIGLDMIDAPGAMATEESVFRESGRLIDNVASSEGLLFLYDPVMEYDRGGSFNYAYSVLAAMARNVSQPGVRLPHYVAVCITKFDEPPVLAAAERLRMIEFDREPPYFPRVPDGLAQDFFREICRASRSDDASLFLPLLTQTFNSDRIRFFVTSAIGFYVDPATGVYDPGDFQNVIRGRLDTRIRGSVHPINVVEPLLWLGRQIASDRGLRKRNGHAEAR